VPKVPWPTRLGKIGEGEIRTRLSYFSVVNEYNTDIGIDFYCQLLENDVPSAHFHVQAKGTEHFDETWSQSIPKSTVSYWLSQPDPVVLVVYDENAGTCYWMSIESRRYEFLSQMTSEGKTIHIRLDRSHTLGRGREANPEFISQVKEDLGSIMLWRGYPQFKGEGYVRQLPDAPRSPIELARVEETLRMTSYSLVRYYTGSSYDWQKARELCELLAKFDKSHYNHFVWLAQIQAVQGDRQAALASWREAMNICERDKVWPKDSMDKIKEAIKREIDKIQAPESKDVPLFGDRPCKGI
jgi:tetratricopeptide (TPR) repeat protein